MERGLADQVFLFLNFMGQKLNRTLTKRQENKDFLFSNTVTISKSGQFQGGQSTHADTLYPVFSLMLSYHHHEINNLQRACNFILY